MNCMRAEPPNKGVALDRAGITVFRDITFLAAGPASERSRWASKSPRESYARVQPHADPRPRGFRPCPEASRDLPFIARFHWHRTVEACDYRLEALWRGANFQQSVHRKDRLVPHAQGGQAKRPGSGTGSVETPQ